MKLYRSAIGTHCIVFEEDSSSHVLLQLITVSSSTFEHWATMKVLSTLLGATLAATLVHGALNETEIWARQDERVKLGKRATEAVIGSAEGFAKGVTGGAAGSTVYPTTNDELVSYLGSSSPLTIVLTKTFDFTATSTTASGCAPWGTGSACQEAIVCPPRFNLYPSSCL